MPKERMFDAIRLFMYHNASASCLVSLFSVLAWIVVVLAPAVSGTRWSLLFFASFALGAAVIPFSGKLMQLLRGRRIFHLHVFCPSFRLPCCKVCFASSGKVLTCSSSWDLGS